MCSSSTSALILAMTSVSSMQSPRSSALVGDLGAALLDGGERVVERLGERLDAFALERVGDVVEVDARRRRGRPSPGARSSTSSVTVSARWLPSPLLQRVDRRRRERVHRVGTDELVDVQRGRSTPGSSSTSTPTADAAAARPSPRARPSAARRTARGTAGTRAWRWRPRPCPAAGGPRGGGGRSRCRPGSRRTTPPTRSSTRSPPPADELLEALRDTPRSPRRSGRAQKISVTLTLMPGGDRLRRSRGCLRAWPGS